MAPLLPAVIAAASAPARGFPPNQVIPASIVAVLLTAGVAYGAVRYRQGRFAALDRLGAAVERQSGLPRWAALPSLLTSVSLLVAVFGFYWDVAWHIDKGRDDGPFSTPAHYPIIIGLLGIAIAGVMAVVLDKDNHPDGIPLRKNWRVSVGGALLLLCGLVALAGFPLDDVWHTLFGQDVTLWGPTHIQMIGGASLATLATWMLQEEGARRHPQMRTDAARRRGPGALLIRRSTVIAAGAFLMGLSTLQGEFDFGVPQFRAVYHPILIMLAAGIGLVCARIRAGRGAAIGAALFFIFLRGLLTLVIVGLGRSTLHFPLYLAEAALVELVALVVSTRRQVLFGAVSGFAIGTIGLAAEWGWTHIWMPLPWNSAMWPEGAILGFVAAMAGGVLGGLAGRALLPVDAPREPSPRLVVPLAWAGALAVIAIAMPMSAHTGYKATVTLTDASPAPQRAVFATVKLDPPQAADNATWFNLTSWQGGTGTYNGQIVGQWVVPMRPTSTPGVYRSATPVPVYGKWKTLLRLGTVGSLQALPVYMPADPAIPAKGVKALPSFTRSFVADKKVLQREAVGGSVNLERAAYAGLGLIGLIWIAAVSFGLRRMDRVQRRSGGGWTRGLFGRAHGPRRTSVPA